MKKVLVATCVMAMTAFGITNASAEPVSSARANAFGISIDLLGEELVEREPEVTSVFPPGGSEEEDVATIDAEELLLEGVGIQQAETSGESNITPELVSDGEDDGGSEGGSSILQEGGGDDGGGDDPLGDIVGGGDDGGGEGGDLLGISLDEILGGGGDDEGDDGSGGGIEGFGGPDDDDIEIPTANARAFSSISITGVAIDEEGGDGGSGGGGSGGGDDEDNSFLGIDLEEILGLGGGGDEGGGGGSSVLGLSDQSAGGGGTVQTQQSEDGTDILDELLGDSGDELQEIVFDALLRLGVIESEAVAVCTGNQVRFDVASRLVDDQGSDIEIGDLLDDVLSEVLGGEEGDESLLTELLSGLIETEEGEVGTTADGGVFINALRITVGEDLGDILGGGSDEGGEGGGSQILQEGGDGGEDEPLLDIVLGHSEVSGTVCAAQAPPPAGNVNPLPPAGDTGTLPVTGGGLGVLPAVLAVGLTGGALTAGRLALRARREHTL
jgi:hypothetical protein